MNATTMNASAPLPHPLRSEAFAEDLVGYAVAEAGDASRDRSLHWLLRLAPLAVALVGVAFAVVPPLA